MSDLEKHQSMLLEMLSDVDDICRQHEIEYMLFSGTMLGAVRHQGFIPWDDDLDIIMLRSDYERFLSVARGELDARYYLQKEFSEHWPMFFSKLRRNHTACIERYIPKDEKTHLGVYIDIFPCDNLSDNKIMRGIQFFASKIVHAKSLDARGYLTDSVVKKLFILLCRPLPKKLMARLAQDRKDIHSRMVHVFFGGNSKYKKSVFPREWFTSTTEMLFVNRKYPVSSYYHEMLSVMYGDYMTPTPEDQRGCKVHGEIVDLNHSYTEYIGIQKKMKFKEYSRSIR